MTFVSANLSKSGDLGGQNDTLFDLFVLRALLRQSTSQNVLKLGGNN